MQKVLSTQPHYSAVYNLKTVGKTAGSKSWHVYKPSRVRNLDVSDKKDAELYEIAQQLQKTVSKGAAKPKYDAPKTLETLYNRVLR